MGVANQWYIYTLPKLIDLKFDFKICSKLNMNQACCVLQLRMKQFKFGMHFREFILLLWKVSKAVKTDDSPHSSHKTTTKGYLEVGVILLLQLVAIEQTLISQF